MRAMCASPPWVLTLALLVLRVDADHSHHASPMDYLALVANLLDGRPDFHLPVLASPALVLPAAGDPRAATSTGRRCVPGSDHTAKARRPPCLQPECGLSSCACFRQSVRAPRAWYP